MKIEGTNIWMASSRSMVQREERREVLRIWVGQNGPVSTDSEARLEAAQARDRATITDRARTMCTLKEASEELHDLEGEVDHRFLLIKLIVEAITGREIRVLKPSDLHGDPGTDSADCSEVAQNGDQRPERRGWGLIYDRYESHYEREDTTYIAGGVIRTSDQEEINFAVQLHMSREFASREASHLRAGDAVLCDPLVINFGGTAAELTDMRFAFDLDTDGEQEAVPHLAPGHGFLALDTNQDGVINDGSELFGPRTGNGFGELATYDEDGNLWIDENDSVFKDLSIWTKDPAGAERLTPLKERGVGAIYLVNVDTYFDLRDHGEKRLGQLIRTGLYLKENGEVGTLQQMNLSV